MDIYTKEDLEKALPAIDSMISRSEKVHIKFKEGTSQFSLIRNRLNALNISKSLILKELNNEVIIEDITNEDLTKALSPIISTINKCEKVMEKVREGTPQSRLTQNMLKALYVSSSLIKRELNKLK